MSQHCVQHRVYTNMDSVTSQCTTWTVSHKHGHSSHHCKTWISPQIQCHIIGYNAVSVTSTSTQYHVIDVDMGNVSHHCVQHGQCHINMDTGHINMDSVTLLCTTRTVSHQHVHSVTSLCTTWTESHQHGHSVTSLCTTWTESHKHGHSVTSVYNMVRVTSTWTQCHISVQHGRSHINIDTVSHHCVQHGQSHINIDIVSHHCV